MPIEYGDVAWPPAECSAPDKLYREWGAWYAGDPEQLQAVYANGMPASFHALADNRHPLARPSQSYGGVAGALARMWWGRPTTGEQPAAKIHLPAAGDLSMYAADLLFGAPPDITVGEPVTSSVTAEDGSTTTVTTPSPLTAWWDEIASAIGWNSRLLEAAEQTSAYGGSYLRVSVIAPDQPGGWVPVKAPIVEAIPPDCAIPTWRAGFLTAVTFWRELARVDKKLGGSQVWRHLERHEPGFVFHALYLGTADKLGESIPLTMRPETERFTEVVVTGATGLTAEYVPNMLPNRLIRGTSMGRSDYSGAEPMMDGLDETWSSWMRDIRLAKGRLVVPEAYLQSNGPGSGASFDAEREIWAGVNTVPKLDGSNSLSIVQFAIRAADHRDTAAALLRQIWRTAGYSTGENGEENEAQAAATATQVVSRNARTASTRKRKIGYWTPALVRIVRAMLEIAQANGLAPTGVERVTPATPISVEFPPAAAPDLESTARTVQLLDQAHAVSTKIKVEMVHPDWSEPEVAAEVAAITGAIAPPEQPTFD